MKPRHFITSIMAGAVLVCVSATLAFAQFQVRIAPGTAGDVIIADGGPNDTDPAPNAIGFEMEIVLGNGSKFIASGHAIQTVNPGKSMELRFDRLTITNTGANQVGTTIEAQTAAFAAIGPPFTGRVHLDGKYSTDPKGVNVVNAQVSFEGSVIQPAPAVVLGTVSAPAAVNQPRPVPFNPPDQSKTVAVGVTQTRGVLTFSAAPHDRIVLPGSAVVAGYTEDQIFVVNSTADLADGLPGDGVCDTGNATIGFTGICTLRAALTEADQTAVVSAIHFNIAGSGVPKIAMQADTTFNFGSMGALRQVIVDGTTQSAGRVEVDGSQSSPTDAGGNPIVGLDLVGANSTVVGLVIHSFPSHAIQIRQSGSPFGGSNVIEGNFLGTDATGLNALPNLGDGVHIVQMPGNVVRSNVIANNDGQGVSVHGSAATGNRIHANSIDANGGLGVALSDSGNAMASAPVLTSATSDGFDAAIAGTVQGAANAAFTFDLFANNQCDPSGAGEGLIFLGSTSATADGAGETTFTVTLPADLVSGQLVTATATDGAGNTSPFSACVNVQQTTPPANQPPVANAGASQTVTVGALVTLDGSGSFDPDNSPSPLTFHWTQTSGPAVTLAGADTATPSFTALVAGNYVFRLVVNDGLADSAPSSVAVKVLTPAPPPAVQIQGLIAQVTSLGLPKGTQNSLRVKLNAALASVNQGNNASARGQLGAFINEVSAQSGKKITAASAAALIAEAQAIIASLG